MATLSIVLFLVIIGLSLYDERVQPGLLAIAAALFVALVVGGWGYAETVSLFPTSLFLTLTGILLFFGAAVANGTIGNLVSWILHSLPARPAIVPFAVAGGVVALTAIGVGNIGATAILAPAGMAIAHRLKLNPFLMILLIVGAANAGALSPLAVTGVTVRELLEKRASDFPDLDIHAFGLRLFLLSFFVQTLMSFIGFFVLGGWKWIKSANVMDLDGKILVWTTDQKITLYCIIGFVVTVLLGALPVLNGSSLGVWMGSIAAVSFCWLSVVLILKAVRPVEMFKTVPWSAILMVTGIVTYIEVATKAGSIDALTSMISRTASDAWLPPLVFAFSALLSVFSSSSAVVMPLFIALAPGLETSSTSAAELVTGVGIAAHLVDTSPLSSLGALCIAAAHHHERSEGLFRKLLLWALLMVPLGAMISWGLALL